MSQKQQHKKKPLKIFFVSLLQFEEEKSMFTQLSKERKSFDFPKQLALYELIYEDTCWKI